MRPGPRLVLLASLAGMLIFLGGCAYFNTFYFAKKHYARAERARAEATEDIVPTEAVNAYDRAILQCKKVLNFHPNSRWVDDAVFLLGASYYGKAAYDSSLTTFDDFARSFPESDKLAASHYFQGLCHYEQEDYEQMEAAFDRALEIDPEFEHIDDILFTRAQTAERQLDYTGAIRAYRRLVSTFPGTDRGEDGLLEIGRLYFEAEQYDSALVAYEELTESTTDEERYQQGQLQLGRSLIRLGRPEMALERMQRQLPKEVQQGRARSEYGPQVRLIMAQALNRMDRPLDAIEVLEVVPENQSNSTFAVEAQYQIGFTYESYMDSLSLAEDAYEKAAKMSARSTFRDLARERLVELKRLIALSSQTEEPSEGESARDSQAEAALKIAELYYFSRRDVRLAKTEYQRVLERFGETSMAPRAAYGLAWLELREEPNDSLAAFDMFRDLVSAYPESEQARAAVDLLAQANRDTSGLGSILIEPEPILPVEETEADGMSEDGAENTGAAGDRGRSRRRGVSPHSDSLVPDSLAANTSALPDSLRSLSPAEPLADSLAGAIETMTDSLGTIPSQAPPRAPSDRNAAAPSSDPKENTTEEKKRLEP